MQSLISLESSSLFFSCRTISFIYYLRDTTFYEEVGHERIFQDIVQPTETVTVLLVLQLRFTNPVGVYREMPKYHIRGIFLKANFITSVYRDTD